LDLFRFPPHLLTLLYISGEALLVSSGLILYFGDMLGHTLSKMEFSMSSKVFIHTPGTRSDMTAIIQGILLGLFLLPLLYKSSLQVWDYCTMEGKQQTQEAEDHTGKRIGSAVFYISLVVVLMFLLPSWTHLVQGLKVHPFVW